MAKGRCEIEKPGPHVGSGKWGSDLIAEMLRDLGFRHVALNPGSSFRGLHDSLVNHLGNENPKMLLCLHEEHAVSIAHGWAKVTGEPMAVILHANVGLMHAAMAIYNAWCDRVPMAIFGATGPVDAAKRRPWIDWIHTARDQAAIVRDYVKWDDQPASLAASLAAMVRGTTVTHTLPHAPTYVCFDVSVQEETVPAGLEKPDPARFPAPAPGVPSTRELTVLERRLSSAGQPVFLMGRMSRDPSDWAARVALAEHFGASVITDIKTGAVFPTEHPLHVGPPSFFIADPPAQALRDADLIVAFDWIDPAGSLRGVGADAPCVNISLDHLLSNGWSLDHMAQLPAELHVASPPDTVIAALNDRLGLRSADLPPAVAREKLDDLEGIGPMSMKDFSIALSNGLDGEVVSFVRLPLGWDGGSWPFRHPLDYLGYDGGAGIGSGPGMLVGAALALEQTDRIPVAVLGDGDVMMGVSALWTAARYYIPFILIVCNNRSYFNDEVHQEKVATMRDRPVGNKSIGQAITEPDIDFASIAKAQGLAGIGPVTGQTELAEAIRDAIRHYREGKPVLVDARVAPEYATAMSEGMTETGG